MSAVGFPWLVGRKLKGSFLPTQMGSQYPPKKVPFLEGEFQLVGQKVFLRGALNMGIWSKLLILLMMRLWPREVK